MRSPPHPPPHPPMDLKIMPDLTCPHVYHYLIDRESVYTKDTVKVFHSLDTYNYFLKGKVWNICSYNADNICIMYCTIGASQTLYTAWFHRSFMIITCHTVWDNLNKNPITDCAITFFVHVRLYGEDPKENYNVLPYRVYRDTAVFSSLTGKHEIVSHCHNSK